MLDIFLLFFFSLVYRFSQKSECCLYDPTRYNISFLFLLTSGGALTTSPFDRGLGYGMRTAFLDCLRALLQKPIRKTNRSSFSGFCSFYMLIFVCRVSHYVHNPCSIYCKRQRNRQFGCYMSDGRQHWHYATD